MPDKLEQIKNSSIMHIKSGKVLMNVDDRDWLIKTVEELRRGINK